MSRFATQAERVAYAREVQQRNAAARAIDDPAKLARAARIVRAAIERGRLEPEDILKGGTNEAA